MSDSSGVNIDDISLDLSNQDEYTILFNKLTKDKSEKFLTIEEFKNAVKTKFGENNQKVNTELTNAMESLSSNTSSNDKITLETFKGKMEYFDELLKPKSDSVIVTSAAIAVNHNSEHSSTAANLDPTTSTSTSDPTTSTSTSTTTSAANSGPATSTTTSAANSVPTTSEPATEAYAIIQIDATGITVLDVIPNSATLSLESPYDLLAKKTPSTFAVKIVKKEKGAACNTSNKIKCINYVDSVDSVYEMDLSEQADINIIKLLNEAFLETESNDKSNNIGTNSQANSTNSQADFKDKSNDIGTDSKADSKDNSKDKSNDKSNVIGIDFKEADSKGADSKGADYKNSGGSRKARAQKSKKTKRKYYVYKK